MSKYEELERLYKELLDQSQLERVLEGNVANVGLAVGEAKIVTTSNFCDKIQKGDILVAPETNPEYISATRLCSAIVTDSGGKYGSHAALVSREFGLPCIVGTNNATKILQDYTKILVDAYRGYVFRVK
jgi:pyruvate,water dikinase